MIIKLVSVNDVVISMLVSWIKSPEDLMQFAVPSFVFPLTIKQLEESLKDPNRLAFVFLIRSKIQSLVTLKYI